MGTNILSQYLASSPANSAAQPADNGGNAANEDVFKAYREPMQFANGDVSNMRRGVDNFYTGENAKYDSNAAKYHLAYQMAMEQGAQTDSELKKLVDENFAALKPSDGMTGEMMRQSVGGGSNAISGAREGMQNMNLGIGNALDAGVDQFGTLMQGLTGSEQVGNTIRDFSDGQDLSIIPSIATDAVSFIPGIGFVLGGAKGAVESSDDIFRAAQGIDPISLEKLDAGQRATAGAAALANVALSAMPGGFAARSAEKGAAEAAGRVLKAREAEKAAMKGIKNDFKNSLKNNPEYRNTFNEFKTAKNANASAKEALNEAQKRRDLAREEYDRLTSNQSISGLGGAREELKQARRGLSEATRTADTAASDFAAKKAARDEIYKNTGYSNIRENAEAAKGEYENALENLRAFSGNKGIGNIIFPGRGLGNAIVNDKTILREMRNPNFAKGEADKAIAKARAEADEALGKAAGKAGKKGSDAAEKTLTTDEEIAKVLERYGDSESKGVINRIKELVKNSRNQKFGGMNPIAGLALAQANLGLQNAADTGQGVPAAYVNAYSQAMEQGDYLPLILANFGGVKRPLGRYTGYSRTPHYIGKAGAMGDVANIENQGSTLNNEDALAFLQTLASTGDMEKARAAYQEAMGL